MKRKGDKLFVKWKDYDNSFNSWIDKKDLVWFYCKKKHKFFSKSFRSFRRNVNVKLDLSNYATKTDLKNVIHVNTKLKTNLANLKTEGDKLVIEKLVPVPTDLSKLSNFVQNDVV